MKTQIKNAVRISGKTAKENNFKQHYTNTPRHLQGKTAGLIVFLKGDSNPKDKVPGCSNYDHYYGGCLFDESCKVQSGQRCGYFEKAVLPTAIDTGQFENIIRRYKRRCKIEYFDHSTIRTCPDCGNELPANKKYCSTCIVKRRRLTYRKARSKRNSLRKTAFATS